MSELALKLIAENKAKYTRGEDAGVLDLRETYLKKIPDEIKDLKWLQEIDLWGNKLSDLTPLTQLTNLRFLSCSGTQVSDLSPISNLRKLNSLDCSMSSIDNLAPISKLNELQWLDCSATNVKNLQPISGLKKLKYLYCTSLWIDDLSPVAELNKLQVLNFKGSTISDLSPIKRLIDLKTLNCGYTRVSDLTPLAELRKLKLLYCQKTLVSDLSPILYFIRRSIPLILDEWDETNRKKGLYFWGCPLAIPAPEILKKGKSTILNYFAEREKLQFENTEIKLILVGNSTVGKTSLSKFFRKRTYTQGQPTTHGILNQQWQPKDREMQVNLWDFGGQEYYHATHRLFLSHNAVYILVWDAQTNKGGFCETPIHFDNDPEPSILNFEHFPQKWWLQNIRHHTRESNAPVPVLLVQNKCGRDGQQRVSGEFEKPPFSLLPEWLDNHIDLEAAANPVHPQHKKWLRQFETFEERLLDKLQAQLAHYEFAIYHRDIHDKVRRLAAEGVNDMPYPDFEKMCRDIETDAKMDLVQIYLRDITGDILYYPHNERLHERVFLRPIWVCDSIYQILSRQVQRQNGLFGLDWVCEALQCDEPNALDFVALMREFELVFPESDDVGEPTGQLVAPQYLPDDCTRPDKLEAAKEYANITHAFTLWFPEFLPNSHIARFVAHWGSQAKQRLFWKNGLLFQTKGCTALVERKGEDKIRVDIQSGHPKTLEAMRHIFESFLKLEDGQASFAMSQDAEHFVWWCDVQDAMRAQARMVKVFPPETENYVNLQPFTIFQKPIMTAQKVFISYSKSDKNYLTELKRHLAPLKRQDLLQTWDDTDLMPGEEWDAAIRRELNSADIVILLVSSDLMATDYVWDIEMKEAMRRHQNGEATVIPVILRPSNWEDAPFGILNALPEKGKPISKWEDRDEGWAQVVARIKQVVK